MNVKNIQRLVVFALATLLLPTWLQAADFITGKSFGDANEIVVEFAGAVDPAVAGDITKYTVFEEPDPDIQLQLLSADLADNAKSVSLKFADPLNTTQTHIVSVAGLTGDEITTFSVAKSYLGYLFSILISALLIQNFVFTKYLGLCVFFGTAKRKSTAKGMGVVFTLVMVISASMAWFLYQFVLIPFNLNFLQIVVFIGLTSLTVQAVDTVLRKVNPVLFNSFGVYLVLVIANCIVIAVPLILANNNYNYFETLMLALGAGGGFLLALYLMSSVSERLELANIPPSFKGLPMAFIVAGQFAMAFLGFSGLQVF
ncbi:electron transport complex protein RnfA [Desulfosediminicola flagellatus]|uniref:electron transport complex protein RnfA n=1 Tax=Desulfosediminicola flagellatus TaxID=2569541 RepID=UPI0010AD9762|nr:Rnf-Nqr domain containing protein [Desulfosediminicola flagellatus]